MVEWITNLDFSLLYWIQENLRADWLDAVCAFLSWAFGFGIPWIVLGVVMFFFKKTRAAGVMLITAVALTFFFNEVAIKNAVCRERPCVIDQTIELAVKRPTSYSFPSGHSSSVFAAVGVSFCWSWLGRVLTGTLISRGANYVSDFVKKLQGVKGGK